MEMYAQRRPALEHDVTADEQGAGLIGGDELLDVEHPVEQPHRLGEEGGLVHGRGDVGQGGPERVGHRPQS